MREKPVTVSLFDLTAPAENRYSVIFTSDDRIAGINYFSDEAVTLKNARLTAVGLLKEILIFEKGDIIGKKALVTGYGRVSRAVCDMLLSNGLTVSVAARSCAQRQEAEERGIKTMTITDAAKKLDAYDYVINTVPEKLFSADDIEKADGKAAFFELAAGLIDRSEIIPKAYIECKGMPGKHTPKSAGRVISDFVSEKLRE